MRKAKIADYDWLYRNTSYGAVDLCRQPIYVKWICDHIPRGSTILDIGCGRGMLIRQLLLSGYPCSGTEICDYLLNEVLNDLIICKVACEELHRVRTHSVDVVICNDVLEHLANEKTAENTFTHICRISRKWILISVGLSSSGKSHGIELHHIIRPKQWWRELFKKHCELLFEKQISRSYLLFGKLK